MLKEYQLLTVIVNFKCYLNSEMFVNQKAFIVSTECMSIRGGTNSSMFEVRFRRFLKNLSPFSINKFLKQFSFW